MNVFLKDFLISYIADEISSCRKCGLCHSRKNTVPGDGNINASLMVAAESPGKQEDKEGKVLVGRSGSLLNKWLNFMGISRSDIFLLNMIKCRPPGNRNPTQKEIECCRPFLEEQISIINPKIILLLGSVALKTMFKNPDTSIMKMRGKWLFYNDTPVMPTLHPAFLLRQMTDKNEKLVASDLRQVITLLKENCL